MLQRAASNAYSWWWASHIRTKQSKWLEQNLQDMGEKVQNVLKLIEEDGDSFRMKAEMYYKKRPELIHFVEESYRAYRALAERYDHISTELQNANNTLAYVFPEQVQFAMEDDEDAAPNRFPKKVTTDSSKVTIPKVPKVPKDLKGIFSSATKKMQAKSKKAEETASAKSAAAKSGLSKAEGHREINMLQKQILGLQTEKEYARSSYEGGLAKYWEIENQIREMQDKVCRLEDEFGAGEVIEDDEARTLMASAALKSCQETLSELEEKQGKSAEEAAVESKRISTVRQKLETLKNEFSNGQMNQEKPKAGDGSLQVVKDLKSSNQEATGETKVREDMEVLRKKINQFEVGSNSSVTVAKLVEKIDALVVNVIGLGSSVSSQTALVQRLRAETDELQAQIRSLEDEKAALIQGKKDMSKKLKEMEEKLLGVQNLNQNVEDQNNNIHSSFKKVRRDLDKLNRKLHAVNSDEEPEDVPQTKESVPEPESQAEFKGEKGSMNSDISPNRTRDVKLAEIEVSGSGSDDALKGLQNGKPEEKTQISGGERDGGGKEVENVTKPEEELKVSGSDNGHIEVQNVKAEEEHKVSDHKELETVKPEVKEEKSKASGSDDGRTEVQNANSDVKKEELKASGSSDGQKEVQNVKPDVNKEELKVSGSSDGQKEAENVKPKEELQVSGSQCDNERSKEQQTVKPSDQIKAPDSSQQEGNHSSSSEKATEEGTKEQDVRSSDKNQGEGASPLQTSTDADTCAEIEESFDKRTSFRKLNDYPSQTSEQETEEGDEPNWKHLFLKGIDNREQTLLAEYTIVLRKFKKVKKKLADAEKKSSDSLFDIMIQLKELKNSNEKKDKQIQSLHQKLSLLQAGLAEDNDSNRTAMPESPTAIEEDVTKQIKQILMEQPENMSEIEKKFRMSIDEVLEENLDFWLRFSNTFQQIQKFDTEVQDLQSEVIKLEEKRQQEGSGSSKYYLKSDARPLYRHLREINTELIVWLEKGIMLKDEVKSRFSSLCAIQEEITAALKDSAEDDDFKFTSYQAAKFQGEILNMKQENGKVADELQAGLDHITTLQLDVDKNLTKLDEDFKLSEPKTQPNIQLERSESRSGVPLRSFIFGIKQKKQKHSILSCVHPMLQKKYNGFRAGMHL